MGKRSVDSRVESSLLIPTAPLQGRVSQHLREVKGLPQGVTVKLSDGSACVSVSLLPIWSLFQLSASFRALKNFTFLKNAPAWAETKRCLGNQL